MKNALNKPTSWVRSLRRYLRNMHRPRGNTMLYVVLVMVILGMLGATVASLFTSSTASSTTLNEDRRARYLYESAARYAMSEMRSSDFDSDVIDALNTTTHTLDHSGTFDFDIYSLWFRSNETKTIPGIPTIQSTLEEGELPSGFSLPGTNIFAVNIESTDTDSGTGKIRIPDSTTTASSTTLISIGGTAPNYTLNVVNGDDFAIAKNERICIAVQPTSNQSVSSNGSLNINESAADIFPKYNGIVFIKTDTFLYDEAVHYPGSHVALTNLSAAVSVTTADFVILWPANHSVIPTANTANVTYGGAANYAFNVVDTGDLLPGKYGDAKPDIDDEEFVQNLTEKSGPADFIDRDLVDKKLIFGDDTGTASDVFGGAWYDADKSVGGVTNFCTDGECRFGLGMRAFFTFEKTGSGNGFVFALLNGAENAKGSIGGDIKAVELLGYAGDSRLVPTTTLPIVPAEFLDGAGRGLQAPKIGLEFDTIVHYDANFEQNQDYCSGANLIDDTRNDPLNPHKDAVQYVFWGRDDFVDIPCRDPSPGRDTYDDNRHDAVGLRTQQWQFDVAATPISGISVGPDGAIYVGAGGQIWALNPDGSEKWRFPSSPMTPGNFTVPTVGPNGTVYTGAHNGRLYAINPATGLEEWSYLTASDIDTSPAVRSDGVIIFGSDTARVYALNPDGSEKWPPFLGSNSPGDYDSSPAFSPDESVVYLGNDNGRLYAIRVSDGFELWTYATGGVINSSPAVATAGLPEAGVIYVGSTDNSVYAIRPDGTLKWAHATGGDVDSSPAVAADGTIYVGSNDGHLYSLEPTIGNRNWRFLTSASVPASPVVDASGHVYFGSDDDNVYALFPDMTEKWQPFDTTDDVTGRLALGATGNVLAASKDHVVRSFDQFAEPRNYRQNIASPPEPEQGRNLVAYNAAEALAPYPAGFLPTSSDNWIMTGPWAVRMEVDRTTGAGGEGDYQLRSWIYQCATGDCSDILGTFYENTRIGFDPGNIPPQLVQSFSLPAGPLANTPDNQDFERFLFGFTSAAAAGDTQQITIKNFQLSFIRPNDPISTDPFIP